MGNVTTINNEIKTSLFPTTVWTVSGTTGFRASNQCRCPGSQPASS